ncbi:hypothetical protein BaRGS_00024211, partial [Batillaria attramentaria]
DETNTQNGDNYLIDERSQVDVWGISGQDIRTGSADQWISAAHWSCLSAPDTPEDSQMSFPDLGATTSITSLLLHTLDTATR